MEPYGIAGLHIFTSIMALFTEIYHIGLYLLALCCIFIIVFMEHMTPMNGPLVLLISIFYSGSVFAGKF